MNTIQVIVTGNSYEQLLGHIIWVDVEVPGKSITLLVTFLIEDLQHIENRRRQFFNIILKEKGNVEF